MEEAKNQPTTIDEILTKFKRQVQGENIGSGYENTKAALDAYYQERFRQIEQAYGGCKKCYGKGYGTATEYLTGHADFIGDKTTSQRLPTMRFCSCDRGKQLKSLMSVEFKQAIERAKPTVETNAYGYANDAPFNHGIRQYHTNLLRELENGGTNEQD